MTDSDYSTASYVLIKNELQKRGFMVREYEINSEYYVEYAHPNGKVWLTRTRHFSYPMNHGAVMEMSDNKSMAYEWMTQFPISLAKTITLAIDDPVPSQSISDLLASCGTLVVKPESSFGSQGLTLDIVSESGIMQAVNKARNTEQLSTNVIIQEQVAGEEVRFAVLDEKVVSAVRRAKLSVVGNGIDTLAELIKNENSKRSSISQYTYVKYPFVEEVVDVDLLDLRLVLPKGETLVLADSTMIAGGASVYEVLNKVHPTYISFIEEVVHKLGAGFIVVDLLVEDYTKAMTRDNTYFNEFNKAPALKMHYSTRDGKHFDIVPLLADSIANRMEKA